MIGLELVQGFPVLPPQTRVLDLAADDEIELGRQLEIDDIAGRGFTGAQVVFGLRTLDEQDQSGWCLHRVAQPLDLGEGPPVSLDTARDQFRRVLLAGRAQLPEIGAGPALGIELRLGQQLVHSRDVAVAVADDEDGGRRF
ncbi:MAG: hypothetical protein U5K33_04460 [Halofilum sp. (in: g-proteobacteria)]|nr:hypothetical protein [Halofilum sp. (in: g-proteobacteria)]